MFAEPVELIQAIAPRRDAIIAAADIRAWGPDIVAPVRDAGFLVQDGMASHLACPNCDGAHVERVMRDEGDPARFTLFCPEEGLLHLRPDQVLRWRVDHAAIASWTAAQLGAKADPREPIAGEAWRWDRVHLTGSKERWALIIVRDLHERTTAEEWNRLSLSTKSIVLSMGGKPAPPPADGPIAYAGWLWEFCDFDGETWEFFADDLLAAISGAETTKPRAQKVGKPTAHEQRLRAAITYLIERIESAQDALRDGKALLPPPTRDEIVAACPGDKTALSKTVNKSGHPLVATFLRLEELCRDRDQVRSFHRRDFPI